MKASRPFMIASLAVAVLALSACTHNQVKPKVDENPLNGSKVVPANTASSGDTTKPEGAETRAGDTSNGNLSANPLADGTRKAVGSGDGTANAGANTVPKDSQNVKNAGTNVAADTSVRVVYFDYDSSDLKANGQQVLQAHAAWLNQHPDAHVRVEGNADERGTREYNIALGERRAKSVAAYLNSNGVGDGQLTIISYGKEKPAVEGHDESAWSKNRRVELHYTAGQP